MHLSSRPTRRDLAILSSRPTRRDLCICHLERSREIFLKDFSAPVEMTDGKISPLPPLLRLAR
ncbi:MAG: hypothetical protein ABII13_02205, partial [Patescibacteria group bacterium]